MINRVINVLVLLFLVLFSGCRVPMPKSSPTWLGPFDAWKHWRLNLYLDYANAYNVTGHLIDLGSVVISDRIINYKEHPEVYDGVYHPDLYLICVSFRFDDLNTNKEVIGIEACDLLVKKGRGWAFMKNISLEVIDLRTKEILFKRE